MKFDYRINSLELLLNKAHIQVQKLSRQATFGDDNELLFC